MEKADLKKVQTAAEDLLADLGIVGTVEVTEDEDRETRALKLQIETPEAATLIGFHGEVLQAYQLVLSFFVHRLLGEWHKVLTNVGDYREKREEQLKRLALNLAMKAKFSGESQLVANLSASERRIIHLVLADHPEVETVSEGEGRQRTLVIRPKV